MCWPGHMCQTDENNIWAGEASVYGPDPETCNAASYTKLDRDVQENLMSASVFSLWIPGLCINSYVGSFYWHTGTMIIRKTEY